MKKPSGFFPATTIIIVLIMVISGCEKFQDNYRKKYLGTWEFRYYYSEQNITYGITESDSVFYTGAIDAGVTKDEIVIRYTAQDTITLHIDKNGLVTDYCWAPSYCYGGFTEERLFKYEWSSRVNAMGATKIYSKKIYGEKKD
jgi:hypothetical protein